MILSDRAFQGSKTCCWNHIQNKYSQISETNEVKHEIYEIYFMFSVECHKGFKCLFRTERGESDTLFL